MIGYASLFILGTPIIIAGGIYALLTSLNEKVEHVRAAFDKQYFLAMRTCADSKYAFVQGLESSLKEIFPDTAEKYKKTSTEINLAFQGERLHNLPKSRIF